MREIRPGKTSKQPIRIGALFIFWCLVIAWSIIRPLRSEAVDVLAPFVPGELIVKYKEGITSFSQDQAIRLRGDQTAEVLSTIHARVAKLNPARSMAQAIAEYKRDPRVEYAEPNYILTIAGQPNDPSFSSLYGMHNTGQSIQGTTGTPDADIDAPEAWDVVTGSPAVVVGVVDTGIDYNHPDLAANVWSNPGGVGGCPAGTHGYNAVTNSCDPFDNHYHGTHVAGTVGAIGNNTVGVTGVAWDVQLMSLKFLDQNGSGTTTDAIEAINFAVQAKQSGVNLRILSNSWGGGGFSQALIDAINLANSNDILFVAAAGNNGRNTDSSPSYPASYSSPNIVSVAATDNRDGLASFSNYGATSVDLSAPGVNTLSTRPNNTYGYLSGTSMATPHVSGAAALVLSGEPALSTADLKNRLLSSVDLVASMSGRSVTGGRLNVCRTIPGCVPSVPPPTYSLSISPSSIRVPTGGGTVTYTATISRINGHANPVDLSVTGLPSGVTGLTLSQDPATGASVTIRFTVPRSVQNRTYTFTLTGTDTVTGEIKSTTAQLRKGSSFF